MSLVIQVEDIQFKSHKYDIEKALDSDILAWLEAIGQDAAATAASKAPVDTGRLKNSISHAVVPDEKAVYIGTNVHNKDGKNYAIYHELGTGIYAEEGGRQTPWAYKDDKGIWHFTRGVPAKHFIQFGASAHADAYGRLLEKLLKQ